jgi:hypothetical protein
VIGNIYYQLWCEIAAVRSEENAITVSGSGLNQKPPNSYELVIVNVFNYFSFA